MCELDTLRFVRLIMFSFIISHSKPLFTNVLFIAGLSDNYPSLVKLRSVILSLAKYGLRFHCFLHVYFKSIGLDDGYILREVNTFMFMCTQKPSSFNSIIYGTPSSCFYRELLLFHGFWENWCRKNLFLIIMKRRGPIKVVYASKYRCVSCDYFQYSVSLW